jgi:hypothetical protein
MTAAELGAALGVPSSTVSVRLTELKKAGKVIKVPDHRWGLPAAKEAYL